VLDCCAAPGGKTTQLSQWMENSGVIIALEKANFRVQSLKSNLERMGCMNVAAFNTSAEHAIDLGLQFDKVLVDAPCAGNYAGDPKWFGKHDSAVFRKNSEEQKRILSAAVAATKKGGSVVYATCSLEPEENESVIDWALRNLPVKAEPVDLSLGDSGLTNPFGRTLHKDVSMSKRFWPHKTGTEGFFIAKLRKWD
ncbi:RsmB/NOP family class I SAM-dependent RNA methyltransferase, partial [Candidatus Woesearchaeota archaeon]|nr:RsmB/NOP family class I SAM-dependent RNA methyltransferase [Candidatus Woesearchaeota archaeon]